MFHLHHVGFLRSAHPDEEGDEYQEGVAEQPDETEKERDALADGSCNLSSLDIFQTQPQQCA